MQIDPSHYEIAVEKERATVAARKAELQVRRDDAQRRADLDSLVVRRRDNSRLTQRRPVLTHATIRLATQRVSLAHPCELGGVADL
jgi:hypothetical protein